MTRSLVAVVAPVVLVIGIAGSMLSGRQTSPPPAERRAVVTYLRELNTLQARQFGTAKRYAAAKELLIQSPLPSSWTFTMVSDQSGYVALVTGQSGEAFTTSHIGIIYEGRALR